MRKFGVVTTTIFVSILLSGVYGTLHDQITYSISPEYFTRFKYQQFGFDPLWFGGHRKTVAIIGVLATWWVGLLIGVVISCTNLIYSDHKEMRRRITSAISIVFMTAVLFGIIGLFFGHYYLAKTGADWWLPENLANKEKFITVGSIHNYSYLGGAFGLVLAIIYLIMKK